VATGEYTKAEVPRMLTGEGLRTAKGKPLSMQTFHVLLRNPLFAGWLTHLLRVFFTLRKRGFRTALKVLFSTS
jgi:hypothetical protein